MAQGTEMLVIAHLICDFKTKFGLPRQSGIVEDIEGVIVFEPPYRDPAATRGLAEYSHLWLLWQFSEAEKEGWSATVRPPRLGGNRRMGVFATRSPYRPNSIGLSSVELKRIVYDERQGPLLYVSGGDLMDGTPIFDIKPYLAFTDSHPGAKCGFAGEIKDYRLAVDIPAALASKLPEEKRDVLREVLAEDPRPAYHEDTARLYGFKFAGFDVHFQVEQQRLTVVEIVNAEE